MENRVGIHTNYFRGTGLESDLPAIAKLIHQAGGNAMELMPDELFRLDEAQRKDFRDLVTALDIELAIGAGRSAQTDGSSPDPAIREASFQRTSVVLELLKSVGCGKWVGLIHAAWPGKTQETITPQVREAYTQRAVEGMQRIVPLLEEYDMQVYFEVVNRFEHFIFNTAQEGMDFCQRIGDPRFHLLLDTFHMNIEEDDICASLRQCQNAGYLGHFHVGEANRSVPGTAPSHMDWQGIFSTLQESNYKGTIMLEPFIVTGCPFASNVSLWRDLSHGADLEQIKKLAIQGIQFVKSF